MNVRRAADQHNVMTVISKPKPVKQANGKKPKSKTICIECGFIVAGKEAAHFPHCEKEHGSITVWKRKTDKQLREMACDKLCRMIVEWRDGCTCVLSGIDGGRCSTTPTWGHVIPQGGSAFLVYELSNSFRQCSTHNLIHKETNPILYPRWYRETFGATAYNMLEQAQRENIGNGLNAEELHCKLVELSDLYNLRWGYGGSSPGERIEAGFYGSIIRDAWVKDGKI
jgi:hypothetical protein